MKDVNTLGNPLSRRQENYTWPKPMTIEMADHQLND